MTRPERAGICRIAALVACAAALLSGCTSAGSRRDQPLSLFFDEADRVAGLGNPPDDVGRLLRGAIDRPITASFRGAGLQHVIREISQKSGLGIGLAPDVIAPAQSRPIDLDLHDMPAGHALDWITRLIGAHYVVEGPRTVFITRERRWASQNRLRMESYAIGTFVRTKKPVLGRLDHGQETNDLLMALRYAVRHTTAGRQDATIVLDDTGSRLTAMLPPRGHAKLALIVKELKKVRAYEPPPDDEGRRLAADVLSKMSVRCDFARQDIRRIADEIGLRANVNVGFDYRLVANERRAVTLQLGNVSLKTALEALARAAGLGDVVQEPGRRFWILGAGQTPRLLRATGQLPWDRAVVRSYHIRQLVDHFGTQMLFEVIRKSVTPGEWDADLPVAFYHKPTGRLIVIHDEEAQRRVAESIDRMMQLGRTRRRGGIDTP